MYVKIALFSALAAVASSPSSVVARLASSYEGEEIGKLFRLINDAKKGEDLLQKLGDVVSAEKRG